MSIVSGASDGIRLSTAAKDSLANAATLGAQTGAAANEVIVPNAITVNNEGNLESTPSYVGRMICIRPWEMKLAAISVNAGGTSHAVSDVITLSAGVAGVNGSPTVTVDAVSGGVITAVSITQADGIQIRRAGMTSSPSPADGPIPQGSTTGSGISATFDVIWEPSFEIRFIIADASNTLTVHEDWLVPPVSGDNWAVSYIMEDLATVNGCTLRAQSGVFECTRLIKLGNSTPATLFAWLSMNDGKAVELDDATNNNLFGTENSVFTVGYVQGGESVNGAYVTTSDSGTAASEIETSGLAYLHDLQLRSPRCPFNLTLLGAAFDADEMKFNLEVGSVCRNAKLYDARGLASKAARLVDITYQKGESGSAGTYLISPMSVDVAGIAQINIDGMILIDMDGLATASGSNGDDPNEFLIRNVRFIGGSRYVRVDDNELWTITNPVWALDYFAADLIEFTDTASTTCQLEVFFSLVIRPIDADAAAVDGVSGFIFEGNTAGGLSPEDRGTVLSSAYDPDQTDIDDFIFEARWDGRIDVGDVCYRTDVLQEKITPSSSQTTQIIGRPTGFIAWRGYFYGKVPSLITIADPDAALDGGIDTSVTLLDDSAITEADRATALAAPTVTPVITKHGPGETDTRPMKVFNYDAGVDTVPTIGETLTQGSATGVVLGYEGSGASGTLILGSWNGTEFTDNQNITGATFDATTNLAGGSGFYEECTWEIDANNESMSVLYDWLAAYITTWPTTAAIDALIAWGGNEPSVTQMVYLGSSGYFSNRAIQRWNGRPSATASDFTDAFTRANEDLSASANWTQISTGAGNDLRVVSNAVAADTTSTNFSAAIVAASAFVPDARYYATMDIPVLPGSTNESMGLIIADNPDVSLALVFHVTGFATPVFQVYIYDYSTAGGATPARYLAVSSSLFPTAVAGDTITAACINPGAFVFSVNGEIHARFSDRRFAGFEAVGIATRASAAVGRGDNFDCGNLLVESDFQGEGVFVHTRGSGVIQKFTMDSGTEFAPVSTVTIKITAVSEGAACKIIADETVGSITAGDVLMEQLADSNGEASTTLIYEGAFGAGLDVIARVRQQGLPNAAIADDGGVLTDETLEANSGATNDMNLLPATPLADDAYYFGHSEQFPRVKIDITDANGTGSTITWEYWNGLAWAALTGVTDDTSNFENTGENVVRWTIPGGWATTSVNSQGPYYYVRARLTTVGSANQTRARKCTLDVTRYLPFTQDNTITATGLTVTAVWVPDNIAKFERSD